MEFAQEETVMYKFSKLLLLPVLIIGFLSLPAQAAVSDFFKGEPDMSPDEIIALMGEPFNQENTGNQEFDFGLRLDYITRIKGYDAALTYYFDLNDIIKSVTIVIPLEGIDLAKHELLLKDITDGIKDAENPLRHMNNGSQNNSDGYHYVYYAEEWLNDIWYITLLSRAVISVDDMKGQEIEPTEIFIRFASVENADTDNQKAIASFKKRIVETKNSD